MTISANIVNSDTAIDVARELARNKGLFVGPSSGANVQAAEEIKHRNPEINTILTFLCDKAEKYLSLMYKLQT